MAGSWTRPRSTPGSARQQPAARRWDAGQTSMVRTLATDRRLLQLVIAPGAGKSTVLRVLAHTCTGGGGHILGLAPSATAAAQLAEATGIPADTLHRLTWAIDHHHPLPKWADRIGPKTLLLIDEAGMADTLTVDAVVHHVVGRGGRVCLVGDDQQLSAIGARRHPGRLRRRPRSGPAHPAAATLHVRGRRNPTPSISTRLVTGSGSVTRWSADRCQREGILRVATQYNLCRPYATCAKHPQLRDELGTSHDHNSVGGIHEI